MEKSVGVGVRATRSPVVYDPTRGVLERACAFCAHTLSVHDVEKLPADWSLSVQSRTVRIIHLRERATTIRRSVTDAIFIRFRTIFLIFFSSTEQLPDDVWGEVGGLLLYIYTRRRYMIYIIHVTYVICMCVFASAARLYRNCFLVPSMYI